MYDVLDVKYMIGYRLSCKFYGYLYCIYFYCCYMYFDILYKIKKEFFFYFLNKICL